MLKRILHIIVLTAIVVASHADNGIKRHEYWIDSDYSKRTINNSSQINVSFEIDLSSQESGIHFLNFRALNTENEWGGLKRMLFYVPEVVNENTTIARYEYWLDNDYSKKVSNSSTGGDVTAQLDISDLSAGVHFFNFRAQNSDGIWGGLKRMLFYVPEIVNENTTIARYEYWLDNDYSKKVSNSSTGGDVTAQLDISDLSAGVHFFNFRAQNSDGIWGGLKRMLFYVPEIVNENTAIARYEYWLDSDYSAKTVTNTSDGEIVRTIDISELQPGVHSLAFRAQNSDGAWGALKYLVFYLSDGTENIGLPLVSYLYRFNSTTTEVPIAPCQSYTMENQVFVIPDAEEFLQVDPTNSNCTFTFPSGNITGVSMTQTSNVSFSIQFKNSNDVLSAPVNADFKLTNNISHDCYQLLKQSSLTFAKVSAGDFYAFSLTSDGTTQYFKANQSCSVAFFDAQGNLLHTPFDGQAVKNTINLNFLSTAGTYYGVVYNMAKDADNIADEITIRLMTTNNMVPTPELTYENDVVTITCLQEGAQLYYTTDGTDPTENSTVYSAPIPVSHNMTIKAIGTFEDMQSSDVAQLVINSFKVETPVIQFANLLVYISCSTPESTIYYTLDGSNPAGTSGILYTAPVSVANNCTVKAVAKRADFNNSDIATFELDVDNVKVATPVITREGNVLTVSSLTNDAKFYYTTDGTEPTTSSLLYTGNITVEHNCIVKVKGFKAGNLPSETVTMVVDWFYAELPVMSINDDETILTITCSTPGAVIYYEIGGADPTVNSLVYTEPLILTDNRIVKAFAVAPNFNNSEIAVFKPGAHACDAAVISSDGVMAYLSTATDDAKVYYTTDGTTPTTNSASLMKSGSIMLSQTTWTIKAVVMKDNMNNSAETTYSVPAYYDRTEKKLYTHEAGHAADGFMWNNGENTDSRMMVSGIFNGTDINFFRTKMPNMQHMDLSGATITEKAFADKAFADMKKLVSISLPADVITVGNGILSGCEHLAAITWNMNITVPAPTSLIGEYAGHENILLYVKINSLAPAIYRNVVQIQNATAESITLSDNGGDFYCPTSFTARKISYTHIYSQKTEPGVCRGWESIALPFNVQTYTHATNGDCAPFGLSNSAKPFWLYELSSSGFTPVTGIIANTPYIISMPNNDNYADAYNLAGTMTFSAENAQVMESETTEVRMKDGFAMYVNYGQTTFSADQIYALNIGEEYQGHPDGSMFVRELRPIRPFECYVTNDVAARESDDARYFRLFDDDETVGIINIPTKLATLDIYVRGGRLYISADRPAKVKIFNTNGQLVRVENVLGGVSFVEGLAGGVYIVNGKKYVVKK